MTDKNWPRFAKCRRCGGDILFAPSAGSGVARPVWLHSAMQDFIDNVHQAEPVPGTERAPEQPRYD